TSSISSPENASTAPAMLRASSSQSSVEIRVNFEISFLLFILFSPFFLITVLIDLQQFSDARVVQDTRVSAKDFFQFPLRAPVPNTNQRVRDAKDFSDFREAVIGGKVMQFNDLPVYFSKLIHGV